VKCSFLFCLLISISSYGIFVPIAAAGRGRSEHTPMDKMLEFSLSRLKESVQETMQKNERFSFENDMLLETIEGLQREKESLSMKKAELSGKLSAYRPRKEPHFREAVDIDSRKERTQELIAIFQRDIRHLEEKVQALNNSLSEKGFNSHKKMLSEKKENGKKNLFEAEKRVNSLEKGNQRLLEEIGQLKNEQNRLASEKEMLQNRANRF
jgi:chromosome segregation ATPase